MLKNLTFPNFSRIFEVSSQPISIFERLIESLMIGLHHTQSWFENSKPFSKYNIHFDLKNVQSHANLCIPDTHAWDVCNLINFPKISNST